MDRQGWAPNTGWLLCDIYFTNGKKMPFSTRQLLRDALDKLGAAGLRFPRRARSRIPSVQAGESAADAGGRDLAAAGARSEPAQSGLPVSHRDALRSDRRCARADPPRRRGARPAAALARNRARPEPMRVHLPPAARTCRRRHDDSVPRGDEADRAPPRHAGELHVPAGFAEPFFQRLASASIADRAQRSDATHLPATSAKDFPRPGCIISAGCWRMRRRRPPSPRRRSTATSATAPIRSRPTAPSGRATIAA